MAYEVVKLQRDGHFATITLNRPDRLNALNSQLSEEIHIALDEVAPQDDIRVVVITGEGRGFCSGADLTTMRSSGDDPEAGRVRRERSFQMNLKGYVTTQLSAHLQAIPQPVIAAVNGVAVGAGLALALGCDMRIASDQARFASIFIKRSIMPDTGVSHMLPNLMGPGIAAEMALTGNIYDAAWALEKGLVNKVVPHDRLMEEVRALAEVIAGNPPIAVRLTKQLIHRGLQSGLQQAIDNENNYNNITRETEDSKEAVLAFLEKRQPTFKGR
ncbi:MAG: enoyl-CoA hydratase/isomerase family protein [Chloroflexi bacterium]|nr:enoyl-CoA hydratase/isomerase family protein [Chloroflexota bacterium]